MKGVWWGCKYAIEAMRKNPGGSKGSIINTASFVAIMGAATPQLAYTASKGAVLAMTRELAMVHAREGIRLNSLCPGPLQTELLMNFLDTPEKKERRMVHIPLGRFGEAIEQAKGALFLASDDSSFITGTDFKVDGGISSCYVVSLQCHDCFLLRRWVLTAPLIVRRRRRASSSWPRPRTGPAPSKHPLVT